MLSNPIEELYDIKKLSIFPFKGWKVFPPVPVTDNNYFPKFFCKTLEKQYEQCRNARIKI